jgi:LEA14-like dessication related protein
VIRRHLALAVALLSLIAGCATFRPQIIVPEVSLANITPLGATLFEQRVRVDLRLRNPNDFAIDLSGVDFQLAVNGARLASGVTSEAVSIPRLGESLVSVEVTTTLLDWMRQIGSLGRSQEIAYDLTGHLHVAHLGRLPFSHSGRFAPGKAPATPSSQGT